MSSFALDVMFLLMEQSAIFVYLRLTSKPKHGMEAALGSEMLCRWILDRGVID